MPQLEDIVYLDNNATTPLDARVLDAMMPYFADSFGNASSTDHVYGSKAAEAVSSSRKDIAATIGAKENEIVFTSGATESNNLAISGVMNAYEDAGDHMITCVTEHESVLSVARHMEAMGKKVTYVPVDEHGFVDMGELEDAVTDRTVLISIMAANNEIGTIQDVASIGKMAHEKGVLFHTDAAQAVGHIPVSTEDMNIDLMSFSAHKMYGPKGIGALYVRGMHPRVRVSPLVYGGGQEHGMRSGTLNVPAIVGFGKAAEIAHKEMHSEATILRSLSSTMFDLIRGQADVALNGPKDDRLPGNLNLYFPGVEGKAIINSVSDHVAISTGSACTTQSVEPSHVIMALGFGEDRAFSSIRVGIGRFSDQPDHGVEFSARKIAEAVKQISKINGS